MTTSPEAVQSFLKNLDNERGQRLFDALPDVRFYMKDRSGQYIHASSSMLVAHGLATLDAIIGHTDHEFIPNYLADKYVQVDQMVLAGEEIWNRMELVLRHRGCPDWYVTTKIPLRSKRGRIVGIAGVTRNLKQAAEVVAPLSRMAPVVDYIRSHYSEPIGLSQLARSAHMSPRSFQRYFQKTFLTTPFEYLRQFRIGKVCQLLVETDASISAISQVVGFGDHSHMVREFTRIMKATPSEYRKRYSV